MPGRPARPARLGGPDAIRAGTATGRPAVTDSDPNRCRGRLDCFARAYARRAAHAGETRQRDHHAPSHRAGRLPATATKREEVMPPDRNTSPATTARRRALTGKDANRAREHSAVPTRCYPHAK